MFLIEIGVLVFMGITLTVKRNMRLKSYHYKPKNTFFFDFIVRIGKVFDRKPQKKENVEIFTVAL